MLTKTGLLSRLTLAWFSACILSIIFYIFSDFFELLWSTLVLLCWSGELAAFRSSNCLSLLSTSSKLSSSSWICLYIYFFMYFFCFSDRFCVRSISSLIFLIFLITSGFNFLPDPSEKLASEKEGCLRNWLSWWPFLPISRTFLGFRRSSSKFFFPELFFLWLSG